MSNQSFPPKSNTSHSNPLLPDRPPSLIAAPNQLSQFTAATASGYHPRPQMNPAAYSSVSAPNTTSGSYQGSSTKPISEFAASAYEAAVNETEPIQPLAAQPIDLDKFKGLKFVTLDGVQIVTREIYDEISGTYKWEMCETQEDRCLNFIRDECANKRVFFISSGSLGKSIIPKIHDLPQVYAVYVYCADVKAHQSWADKFSKVRIVCNDDDKYLLPRFAVDVAQANIDWGNAFLKQGKRDKAKEKFEKAFTNLTKHAKRPDPAMINQVKSKLDECK